MSATVTTKGQVTIPKPVRDFLGFTAGSKVDFQRNANGEIVLKPANKNVSKSRFSAFRSHAGEGMGTDAIYGFNKGL